jgi:hypothetical protein
LPRPFWRLAAILFPDGRALIERRKPHYLEILIEKRKRLKRGQENLKVPARPTALGLTRDSSSSHASASSVYKRFGQSKVFRLNFSWNGKKISIVSAHRAFSSHKASASSRLMRTAKLNNSTSSKLVSHQPNLKTKLRAVRRRDDYFSIASSRAALGTFGELVHAQSAVQLKRLAQNLSRQFYSKRKAGLYNIHDKT